MQDTELLVAGFPCIDVSRAGLRRGLDGQVCCLVFTDLLDTYASSIHYCINDTNDDDDDDAEYWFGEACVPFVASCQGQKQASELGPFGKCMFFSVYRDASVV